jgi:hypothetical protein
VSAIPYLQLAIRDARAIELRCCREERWASGLYSDIDGLRAAIRERAGRGNLYITLNRPRADVPVPNGEAKSLTDADIERVVRIPVDFDPVRPAECMATDEELARAVTARDRFLVAMHTIGWPMPLTAMSGSGAHAMYRCSIPASPELREMLAAVYAGWRRDFGSEHVTFDCKVRNPSRIFRLYGTMNRKGENIPERPWRRAACTLPASGWQAVQLKQIEALANRYARSEPSKPQALRERINGAGDYRTLDVVALMRGHGLYKRALGGGKHAVTCPWLGEHSGDDHALRTDTVVWEANPGEWPRFYCSHAHCEGRTARALLERLGDADAYCSRSFAARAA